MKNLLKYIKTRQLIFLALMIFGFLCCIYYFFNTGAALFDPNDNFPWRSKDRIFSIKLVEEENTPGRDALVYNVAFSNNGFITSEYLHYLNDVGRDPFESNYFVFKEYDEKRKEWLRSLTYEDCLRINDSVSSHLDRLDDSKKFPTIEITPVSEDEKRQKDRARLVREIDSAHKLRTKQFDSILRARESLFSEFESKK